MFNNSNGGDSIESIERIKGIKSIQGRFRGWQGRYEAQRRRVIREAVRFVVRTSILFGAARASAELMEPHFAAGMIQKKWRKVLRKRRIRAMRMKRHKFSAKPKTGGFGRSTTVRQQ